MQSACEACPLVGMGACPPGIFLSMLWVRNIFAGSILVSIPVITRFTVKLLILNFTALLSGRN